MSNRDIKIPGHEFAALSRIGQRRQVVIPKKIFDGMKLREGDFMEVTSERGRVLMRPKRLVDLEDTLTPREAKMIRRGVKQMKERKTRPWTQIKHDMGL